MRNYLFGAFDKLWAMQHRPWTQCPAHNLYFASQESQHTRRKQSCSFFAFSALGLSQVGRECLLLLESTFVTEICQDARKWFTTLPLKIYSQLLLLSHLSKGSLKKNVQKFHIKGGTFSHTGYRGIVCHTFSIGLP